MGGLADLAWSLAQHPRARFAVCVNAGLDNHSGSAAVADTAAMLSGQAWRRAGAPGFELLGGWGPVLCLPACHARLSQSSKGCACVSTSAPCPTAAHRLRWLQLACQCSAHSRFRIGTTLRPGACVWRPRCQGGGPAGSMSMLCATQPRLSSLAVQAVYACLIPAASPPLSISTQGYNITLLPLSVKEGLPTPHKMNNECTQRAGYIQHTPMRAHHLPLAKGACRPGMAPRLCCCGTHHSQWR